MFEHTHRSFLVPVGAGHAVHMAVGGDEQFSVENINGRHGFLVIFAVTDIQLSGGAEMQVRDWCGEGHNNSHSGPFVSIFK